MPSLDDALRQLNDLAISGQNIVDMSDDAYKSFANSLKWSEPISILIRDQFLQKFTPTKSSTDENPKTQVANYCVNDETEKAPRESKRGFFSSITNFFTKNKKTDDIAALKAENERLKELAKVSFETQMKADSAEAAEEATFKLVNDLATIREESFEQILHHFNEIAMHGTMQVCFVIDGTGSMGSYINEVKNSIIGISKKIVKATSTNTSFALVVYRDFDDEKHCEFFGFSTPDSLSVNLSTIQATGGDDTCEDCFYGLMKAFELPWATPGRLVIWIGDAPQHGRRYNGGSGDSHPNYDAITGKHLAQLCVSNSINLTFIKLNNITDTMISVLQSEFKEKGATLTVAAEGEIAAGIEALMRTSALSTATRAHESGVLRDIPLNRSSEFGATTTVEVYTAAPVRPQGKYHPLDLLLAEFPYCATERLTASITKSPFAKGEMRYAYHCKMMSRSNFHRKWSEKGWVAKLPIRESNRMSRTQLRMQIIARFIADEFTIRIKGSHLVEYIPVQLMKIDHEFWMLEPFISGEYIKFNNNAGGVTAEYLDKHPIPQALSHFSYVFSAGHLLLCDVQGVISSKKYTLTDPAIHTCKVETLPDPTNHGTKGIAQFFATHKCNQFCTFLSLPKFDPNVPIAAEKGSVEAIHTAE